MDDLPIEGPGHRLFSQGGHLGHSHPSSIVTPWASWFSPSPDRSMFARGLACPSLPTVETGG